MERPTGRTTLTPQARRRILPLPRLAIDQEGSHERALRSGFVVHDFAVERADMVAVAGLERSADPLRVRVRGTAHCHVRIGPPVLFLEWFGDCGENPRPDAGDVGP